MAFAKVTGLAELLFLIIRLVGLNRLIVGLIGWLVQSVGQLLVQLVDVLNIVLAIIFLNGSRQNHSPKQSRIHIGPLPGLPVYPVGSFRLFRFLFILLHFYGRSTLLLKSLPLKDYAIINEGSKG